MMILAEVAASGLSWPEAAVMIALIVGYVLIIRS
jgi:hypothetical protein